MWSTVRRPWLPIAWCCPTGADETWRLLGVLALADPPREDSAATITAARELGVEVKMVTGDQVAIGAKSPARSA